MNKMKTLLDFNKELVELEKRQDDYDAKLYMSKYKEILRRKYAWMKRHKEYLK